MLEFFELQSISFYSLLSLLRVIWLSKVPLLAGAVPGLEPNTELAPPHQAIILNENQEFIPFYETQYEPF